MSYVLIFALFYAGQISSGAAEFDSLEKCELAGRRLEWLLVGRATWTCNKK